MANIYEIEVQEFLSRVVAIEADSEAEAVERVKEQYNNGEIVLDASDFVEKTISVLE